MSANERGDGGSSPAPEPTAGDARTPLVKPESRLGRLWSKLRWRVHCLAPNLVPHPHGGSGFDAESDKQENEHSRVRLDRQLRAPMIWGVELYGPAEIEGLYSGLRGLGWTRIAGRRAEHDADNEIRRMRSNGGGAWVNIGHIRRHGDDRGAFLSKNSAAVPPGVDYLLVSASQITPSLTALVIGFELQESLAQRYEAEINLDRKTVRRRGYRSWSVEWLEPGRQKAQSVERVRRDHRAMVGAWISRNVPGYFSGRQLVENYPTMELLVARGLSLHKVNNPGSAELYGWRRLLMGGSACDVWDSEAYPGLEGGFERHHDKNPSLQLYLAIDPQVFNDEAMGHHRGSGAGRYSWFCDEMFSDLLTHLAMIEYLDAHTQDLHAARERLKFTRTKRRDIARSLDEISCHFEKTLGSPAVIRELTAQSVEATWYHRSCGDFGAEGWNAGERRMLRDEVRAGVHGRASRLVEDEASLRTHLEQLTTVLSVRESIRLQRWTLILSLAALGIASVSLMIAEKSASRAPPNDQGHDRPESTDLTPPN